MRTKTLLCAAALAAGIATSAVAQSNVYSLNVVGYYNVPFTANQKLMIGNQLNTTNNTLAGIIPNPVPGSQFFKFANGGFTSYTFDDIDLAWTPNGTVSLAPGEGGFFVSPVAATLTFVGEVRQGSLTNVLPKNTKVIRTSIVPQAGRISTDLGVPAEPGDQAFFYNGGFTSYTFDDIDLAWTPNEPTNAVGQGFFYTKNPAATQTNWIRNFTVQ